MLNTHALRPTLPASDLDRAKKFWGDTVGCRIIEEHDQGFIAAAGGEHFLVYPSQFAGTNKATAAAFQVDDVDLEVKRLRGLGVQFQEYDLPQIKTVEGVATTDDGRKAAWFTDSEGNLIGVSDLPI